MTAAIVVVIPTRNRVEFAQSAVRSVLVAAESSMCAVTVVVSDNSSDVAQAVLLEDFCAPLSGAATVTYRRASGDLGMSEHWDWIRRQLGDLTDADHCLFLTDRSVLKPHALAQLSAVMAEHPSSVISYDADEVSDRSTPVALRQVSTSGALVRVPAARLLYLCSQLIVVRPIPRMLNCLVPVGLLDRLAAVHGTVFDSMAPDFTFCYRVLRLVDHILFLDESLYTMYGTARSNGASTHAGIVTADGRDYLRRAAESGGLSAGTSLLPVTATYAVIAQEYVRAAAGQQGTVMPALSESAYLRAVTLQTEAFVPGPMREDNTAILVAAGVHFTPLAHRVRLVRQAAHYARVLGIVDFVVQAVHRLLDGRPRQLPDTEAALDFAARHRRASRLGTVALHYLRGDITRRGA